MKLKYEIGLAVTAVTWYISSLIVSILAISGAKEYYNETIPTTNLTQDQIDQFNYWYIKLPTIGLCLFSIAPGLWFLHGFIYFIYLRVNGKPWKIWKLERKYGNENLETNMENMETGLDSRPLEGTTTLTLGKIQQVV